MRSRGSAHAGALARSIEGESIVGAHLDAASLRQRIYAFAAPGLAIDEPDEFTVARARIHLVNVAPALEEIRCQGKLRARRARPRRVADPCGRGHGAKARRLPHPPAPPAMGPNHSDASDRASDAPHSSARCPSPSERWLSFPTKKLSGPAIMVAPWRSSRLAMPRDARPVGAAGPCC